MDDDVGVEPNRRFNERRCLGESGVAVVVVVVDFLAWDDEVNCTKAFAEDFLDDDDDDDDEEDADGDGDDDDDDVMVGVDVGGRFTYLMTGFRGVTMLPSCVSCCFAVWVCWREMDVGVSVSGE